MRVYKSKEELKAEINKTFEKYISEFDSIPESLKDKRVDEVDRTPAENLAYQVGWTTLVLKWEKDTVGRIQMEPTWRAVSVVHGYLRSFVSSRVESRTERKCQVYLRND